MLERNSMKPRIEKKQQEKTTTQLTKERNKKLSHHICDVFSWSK